MLKGLKSSLKKESKDKEIFDIVIYGSAVKGKAKPNDVDIAVIFRSGSLRERLDKVQRIKERLDTDLKVDMKGLLLEELFRPEFFGKTGIFLEGFSVFDDKPFSKKIGFEGSTLFTYSLKDKSHTEKVKFNYILSGRGKEGLIKLLEGKHIAPGVIEIPISNSDEFTQLLQRHNIDFKKKNMLKQA
ncbi:MAG: nucleotidyltransferase domain-containing protein [Nanoarchaeota archaeon]|nr:nucleotidyltransferase domain-containing protein [Nanoarchaeota archaeon]